MTFTGRISDFARGHAAGYADACAGNYIEWEGVESDAFLAGYDDGFDLGIEDSNEYGDEVMS